MHLLQMLEVAKTIRYIHSMGIAMFYIDSVGVYHIFNEYTVTVSLPGKVLSGLGSPCKDPVWGFIYVVAERGIGLWP